MDKPSGCCHFEVVFEAAEEFLRHVAAIVAYGLVHRVVEGGYAGSGGKDREAADEAPGADGYDVSEFAENLLYGFHDFYFLSKFVAR